MDVNVRRYDICKMPMRGASCNNAFTGMSESLAEFAATGGQIMRAADCKLFAGKPAGFFGSLIYDNSCRGASPAFQPAGWPLRRRRSGGEEIAPPINDIRKRHGAKNAPKDQRTPSRRGRVSAYRGDHRSTVYTYIDKERGYDLSLYNQHVKKPRRVSRPQTRKQYNLFSAATCAWQKTLCAE